MAVCGFVWAGSFSEALSYHAYISRMHCRYLIATLSSKYFIFMPAFLKNGGLLYYGPVATINQVRNSVAGHWRYSRLAIPGTGPMPIFFFFIVSLRLSLRLIAIDAGTRCSRILYRYRQSQIQRRSHPDDL